MSSENMNILTRGIFKSNPTFRLALGLCPTLAVTTSLTNSFTMGIATASVLILSNMIISMMSGFVPKKIRILSATVHDIHQTLGIYIPLIVVNCIILGRAEAFASRENVFRSGLDGIGMGIGFILSICLIGIVREFFGTGAIVFFGTEVVAVGFLNMPNVMILGPGAFLTLGLIMASINYLSNRFGGRSK